MISILKDPFIDEFQILDGEGTLRGFLWKNDRQWQCRVENSDVQSFVSRLKAIEWARTNISLPTVN